MVYFAENLLENLIEMDDNWGYPGVPPILGNPHLRPG